MPISAAERSWQLLTDEELDRWSIFYQRRLALVDDEIRDPFEREPTRQYLAMLVADAAREERGRDRAAGFGVPRDRDHFPPAFVADLKARVRLDELLEYEAGARLRPANKQGVRRGPCPFCRASEHSVCLAVYIGDPADQHYHCFKCGAAGDAISAIMQSYGESFRQAVEHLARNGNIPLPEPAPETGAAAAEPVGTAAWRGKRRKGVAFMPR